jgi:hypothetical protein
MSHHHDDSYFSEISNDALTVFDSEDNGSNNDVISCTKTSKAEVRQVKALVVLVVLFSICGAVGVFFYTKFSEVNLFESQYADDANKVSFL